LPPVRRTAISGVPRVDGLSCLPSSPALGAPPPPGFLLQLLRFALQPGVHNFRFVVAVLVVV